jgi:hypothetical protein
MQLSRGDSTIHCRKPLDNAGNRFVWTVPTSDQLETPLNSTIIFSGQLLHMLVDPTRSTGNQFVLTAAMPKSHRIVIRIATQTD